MPQIPSSDIVFIINPNSGNKRNRSIIPRLQVLDPAIATVITQNETELNAFFNENFERYTVFVVVGGDGSVNKVLPFFVKQSNKFLAVYPGGSGNGFAREMGFKNILKPLLEDIKKGKVFLVDLLSINGKLCINAAGMGIDSEIASDFETSDKRGLANYIKLTQTKLKTFKPFSASLNVNDRKIDGEFMMITLANTRQFGNNAMIAPLARPNDGYYDIILVKPIPLILIPLFITKMFQGLLKPDKYIEFIRTKKPCLLVSDHSKFHLDGIPVDLGNKLKVKIRSKQISIIKTRYNHW